MTLDEYLKGHAITEQQLAAATGCSQATINRVRNGKQRPSLDLLESVARATNGAVTPNDFISLEPEAAE